MMLEFSPPQPPAASISTPRCARVIILRLELIPVCIVGCNFTISPLLFPSFSFLFFSFFFFPRCFVLEVCDYGTGGVACTRCTNSKLLEGGECVDECRSGTPTGSSIDGRECQ